MTNHNKRDKVQIDRRQIERRKPRRGINIRHDDTDTTYLPKRVRKGNGNK